MQLRQCLGIYNLRMSRVSAVLFDFGMVLSGPPSPVAWDAMKGLLGLREDSFRAAYWAPRDDYDRGTLNAETYWKAVADVAGITLSDADRTRLIALDVDLWTEMNLPMIAWVQALHAAGVRTGILSNIGDAMAAGIRAKFDWIGSFNHAVWSHELLMRKPEPAIYAAAVKGLGVPAAEVLFLDDRQENIDAAIAAGLQGLVYTEHESFEREMRQRGLGHLLEPVSIEAVVS